MKCITTVSYSILINEEPSQTIHPSRGLRQGDPLSPYLFLLCIEGLHGLISRAATSGDIRSISICRNEASGQRLNREQTTLFFSKNTASEVQDSIKALIGVPEIKQYEKYLGLPSFVGRRKRASLAYIKDCIWSKLQEWKEKLLSQAGREVLLKAVVQAIPTYSMSCFKLPATLCHKIEIMIRKFWWGQRIHWVKWRTLCKPKAIGGMGFKELQKFNDAMLAKQVWRLLQNQDSLFFCFFKSKFFPCGSIFDAKENKGSFAWRSILKGRDLIRSGLKWRIGNGSKVDKSWKVAKIDSMFIPEEAAIIKAIPLSLFDWDDLHFWPYTRDGVYIVKLGYQVLMEQEDTESQVTVDRGVVSNVWKAIWSMRVPNRVGTFVWLAGTNSLPTKVNLVRRKVLNEDVCLECKAQLKDTMHALWTCLILKDMWKVSFSRLMADTGTCSNFIEILEQASTDKFTLELFAITVSEVWQHRNRAQVGEPMVSLNMLPPKASNALREF
ncbi:putative ribonuclease H protein At1g65750 [Quercus suber]|uniref:putative ribonuclease H protein At1g65750 n=1 Tax=Quercus suber TaxID=58331 RepID=UPI0032E006FD